MLAEFHKTVSLFALNCGCARLSFESGSLSWLEYATEFLLSIAERLSRHNEGLSAWMSDETALQLMRAKPAASGRATLLEAADAVEVDGIVTRIVSEGDRDEDCVLRIRFGL